MQFVSESQNQSKTLTYMKGMLKHPDMEKDGVPVIGKNGKKVKNKALVEIKTDIGEIRRFVTPSDTAVFEGMMKIGFDMDGTIEFCRPLNISEEARCLGFTRTKDGSISKKTGNSKYGAFEYLNLRFEVVQGMYAGTSYTYKWRTKYYAPTQNGGTMLHGVESNNAVHAPFMMRILQTLVPDIVDTFIPFENWMEEIDTLLTGCRCMITVADDNIVAVNPSNIVEEDFDVEDDEEVIEDEVDFDVA